MDQTRILNPTDFSFVAYRGNEILEIIPQLAYLRMTVFYEFPYLYDGNLEYETEYLKTYAQSKQAVVIGVWHANQLIGASTCIPLIDESDEIKQPFLDQKIALESVMYFGESIVLKPFRGLGIGRIFFEKREAVAQSIAGITTCYFCAVDREADHPLRPNDYLPNDVFWTKLGYQKQVDLACYMNWKDRGVEQETEKKMVFWMKKLG